MKYSIEKISDTTIKLTCEWGDMPNVAGWFIRKEGIVGKVWDDQTKNKPASKELIKAMALLN
jgi:hypothetical protein